MSIAERIGNLLRNLNNRQNVSPKNRIVNSYFYGFDNQDETGKEAFARRLNGEALASDPTLKDLVNGKKTTSQ